MGVACMNRGWGQCGERKDREGKKTREKLKSKRN